MLNNFKYGNIMDIKDVKVGDWVECLDDEHYEGRLIIGSIYKVKYAGIEFIELEEDDFMYNYHRFKLIRHVNMEEFQIW